MAVGGRLVGVDDVGDQVEGLARVDQADHRVARGVGGGDLDAQVVVDLGVVVRGEGHGDDVGLGELLGDAQRRAEQGDGGEVRGAVADQGQQDDRTESADLVELGVCECIRHGDERASGQAGLGGADLGRGEAEPAERPELGRAERGHRPRTVGALGDPRQGEPFGVDELDQLAVGQVLGDRERDRAARLVERLDRREGARDEELQVVELTRGGAVLGHGGSRHAGHHAKVQRNTRHPLGVGG